MGRSDGKKIKGINGFDRMLSLVVGKTRTEVTNLFSMDIVTKSIDEYIEAKKKEGIEYTYRDILIATLVRVFYLRPRFNRFVIAGNFYQRKHIDISMSMHKNIKTGDEETSIKCRFTGKETIMQVKAAFDEKIKQALDSEDSTGIFSKQLSWMPTWMFRLALGWLRLLDRYGMLSDKFMFNISPMHSSIFFADLKSIHLDKIYHHLYNFGNCGFFCTMGKETMRPVVDEKTNEIKAERVLSIGVSIDERFVDGHYYSGMIKYAKRLLENLSVLERAPEDDEIKKLPLTNREKKKKAKAEKKAAKRARKTKS